MSFKEVTESLTLNKLEKREKRILVIDLDEFVEDL